MSPLSATAILAAILSVNFAHGFDNSTSNIGPVGRRAKDTLVRLPRTGAEQVEPRQHLHRKWVSDIFMEAREAFDMHGDVSAACRRDFAVYQQFLENQTVWAIRMMESSQWPLFGIFAGITHHFGNWDECHQATPPDFYSQYCLVTAKFNFSYNPTLDEGSFEWNTWPGEQRSAWDVIQLWTKDENRISRQVVSWAMCIPSTCGPPDLEIALNETLYPIFKKYDLTTSVHVQSEYCKTNEQVPYPITFYIVSILLLLGICNTTLLTIYESNVPDNLPLKGFKRLSVTYARFFSFRLNWRSLRKFSPENTFPIIHLFKILAAFFVLSGHRLMLFYIYPTFNTERHEMIRQEFTFELVETSVVDIFITISGFLMFHYSYESIRKGGALYIFFYIIIRWLRMMSVPILLIIIILFIAQYLHNGPIWNHYFSMHAEFCRRNWWTTIFAVNNIIEPDKPCLPQTWYLSVDLQLTIMGAIILLIMSKNMKLGVILCILLTVASVAVTAIIIFAERYWAILKFTITNAKDFVHLRDYYMFYVAPYNRVGSYIIGILAALISRKLKEKKYQFSPMAATLILVPTFIIGFAFTCYGLVFYKANRPYDVVENAIYGAFCRILFSLPFACLLCIHFTSGLGVFNSILDNKVYVPYGRLVYCVYLVGAPLQAFQVISQRTYLPAQDKIVGYWLATGDLVWVYFFALVTYLTVEAPCNNLLKFGQDKLLKMLKPR